MGPLPTFYSTGIGKCHTCGNPIQEGDFIAKKEYWWSHGECLGIVPPKEYLESRQESAGCASIVALAVCRSFKFDLVSELNKNNFEKYLKPRLFITQT